MSYYTHVRFEFSEEPPVDKMSHAARAWLTAQNLYSVDDVMEDLVRGWNEGQTDFKGLVSEDIEGLMTAVSKSFPNICFSVRGMGEDFTDLWLREFESGKILTAEGPFEDDDEDEDEEDDEEDEEEEE
jgi:hypothetical protein